MEIAKVIADCSRFEDDKNFSNLIARWDADFDLWRLKPYDAGEGYYSYTSNSPRLLAKHIITKLAESKLLLRVPEDTLNPDERETANNNERLVHGAIAMHNLDALGNPVAQPLEDDLAWLSALRGGYAVRVLVYKGEDNETKLDIAIWDLYNMRYGISPDGLPWAAHVYTATKEEIKSSWDKDISGDTATVYDVYDKKDNGVIVNKEWVKQPAPHGLDYTPVWVLFSGSQPKVERGTYNTDQHRGESILSSNRNLYPMLNKLYSDYFSIVRRGVKVPMGYWSTTGRKQLESDIWQVQKAASIPLMIGEKIEPILPPAMPVDAAAVVNILVGEEQRGGLSHVAMGDLGFRLSGYAISQLKDSVEAATMDSLRLMERGYQLIARELLRQFGGGDWKPVKVRGRTSKGELFGVPKAIQISPKDVEPDWMPEVRLTPILPRDDAQRYELAQMATQGDRPLLSQDTARDLLIELPNPKAEEQKIDREWSKALPPNRLFTAFVGALATGNKEEAANVLAELQKYMQMGQIGNTGGGGASGPQKIKGPSSSTMPFEAQGGVPPGAQNANGMSPIAQELGGETPD